MMLLDGEVLPHLVMVSERALQRPWLMMFELGARSYLPSQSVGLSFSLCLFCLDLCFVHTNSTSWRIVDEHHIFAPMVVLFLLGQLGGLNFE